VDVLQTLQQNSGIQLTRRGETLSEAEYVVLARELASCLKTEKAAR
jgi:hypothetical protein